jgi:hypothetical protein
LSLWIIFWNQLIWIARHPFSFIPFDVKISK